MWPGNWGSWGADWNQTETRQDKDHAKDVDPPEWDGTTVPLLTYLRHIALWEAETKVPAEKRGLRLLARSKDKRLTRWK